MLHAVSLCRISRELSLTLLEQDGYKSDYNSFNHHGLGPSHHRGYRQQVSMMSWNSSVPAFWRWGVCGLADIHLLSVCLYSKSNTREFHSIQEVK
jgi:hypothetical protein